MKKNENACRLRGGNIMFEANKDRYNKMQYRNFGNTGLKMPVITLGLAFNYSEEDYEKCREVVLNAFNNGITSFDVSSSLSEKPGELEVLFGKIMKSDLLPYREELVITTKIGGNASANPARVSGSRKYIVESLNKSLERLGTSYVDILYHEGYDAETPIEETAVALSDVVRSGKALYIGLQGYSAAQAKKMAEELKKLNVPFVGVADIYNIFEKTAETDGLFTSIKPYGGFVACRPLAEGLLSNKYISDFPADSRALKKGVGTLEETSITVSTTGVLTKLNLVAASRGQSIAQMAISWALRDPMVASVVVGVSKLPQLQENISALSKLSFSIDDVKKVDKALK